MGLNVKQALALFEGRVVGKTPAEIEQNIDALIVDERASVDDMIAALRYDEENGNIERRGRGQSARRSPS